MYSCHIFVESYHLKKSNDYNVYKIEDIDTYKYEIIKKDNKNYIYPLILTTKEDSTQ